MQATAERIQRGMISRALLSLVAGAAILVGGTLPWPATPGIAAAPAPAVTPVKLTIAVWGARENIPVRDAVLAAFCKAHPEIEVQVEYFPTDYMTKLEMMIAAGDAPDVFWINHPKPWLSASKTFSSI